MLANVFGIGVMRYHVKKPGFFDQPGFLTSSIKADCSSTLMVSKLSHSLHVFIPAPRTIKDNAGTARQLLTENG